jgi:hypothetical protein
VNSAAFKTDILDAPTMSLIDSRTAGVAAGAMWWYFALPRLFAA